MQGLVTRPGAPHSARVADVPVPEAGPGEVLVRVLEVGVCGTDREIAAGLFGIAPEGEDVLVLGHELLGVVERDAPGHARGDLVTATVRRSCEHCPACAAGAPDACETGDYRERGITRLHGFARELVAERADQLVAVPRSLGSLGVLTEPASICERGLRHARAVGRRQPWSPSRALVLGAGAIGTLASLLLRLDGLDVWTLARSPADGDAASIVRTCGAHYVPAAEGALSRLAAEVGGFDLVVEATGDAQTMVDTLSVLRRNGVACLLGLDPRERAVTLPGTVVGVDMVLQNHALVGSVNAHRRDWGSAVEHLDRVRIRWPDALERLVGLRVPLDRFEEAFRFRGVKATLALSA